MASIEPGNIAFRIVFRFGGRKYSRTLNTGDPSVASSVKTTVEQRINLIKSGMLPSPPDGHDVAGFLISGETTPTESNGFQIRNGCSNFEEICDGYLAGFLRSSVEEPSFKMIETHVNHLKRIIGIKTPILRFGQSTVQRYISTRSKERGIRGSNKLTFTPNPDPCGV